MPSYWKIIFIIKDRYIEKVDSIIIFFISKLYTVTEIINKIEKIVKNVVLNHKKKSSIYLVITFVHRLELSNISV